MPTQQLLIRQRANEVFRSTAGTLSAYRPLQSLSADKALLHPNHCRILPYPVGRTSELRCTILQPSNQTCSRKGLEMRRNHSHNDCRALVALAALVVFALVLHTTFLTPSTIPTAQALLPLAAAGCAATSRADDHRRAAETRIRKWAKCQTTGSSPASMRRSSSRASASSRRIPSRSKRSMDSTRAIRALPKSPRRKCNCDRTRLLSAM